MNMKAYALIFDKPQPYRPCAKLQERLVAARIADLIPDTVLFLEHLPVVTLGRRGRDNYLKSSLPELRDAGIELVHASRGGDVTFHGPGQLVMYPILQLGSADADAHGYLWNLEEIAIRTAADFDVEAYRREGMSGAWTDVGKIAAIGFKLTRWVSCHGMSFNVDLDLSGFETIVPCGLEGEKVASLQTLLGESSPSIAQVRESMCRHFQDVCGRTLDIHSVAAGIPEELAAQFSM